ncbi:kinase-like domain-containing protein [Blakeslea trispora]|nr:kinase-like domain-containing protein [Blakeslea trispora]
MILSRSYQSNKDFEGDPLSKEEDKLTTFSPKDKQIALQWLEKTLLRYKHDIRYRNSPRYLRLWLVYAFHQRQTEKSFVVLPILYGLIENKICDKLAILYEAIAYILHQDKHLKQVERTLLLGLKRRAEPIRRLNRTLHHFKTTHLFDFPVHHYQWLKYTEQANARRPRKTLQEQLDWLTIKLQHSIRSDVYRDCHKSTIALSIEELRARHYRSRLISPDTQTHAPAVVQLPHSSRFIEQQIQTHMFQNKYYVICSQDGLSTIKQLQAWFPDDQQRKKTSRQHGLKLIQLSQDKLHVIKKIGQGGMAQIYLVQHTVQLSSVYVLKVQKPPHPWEYYILSQLQQRLNHHQVTGFHLIQLHAFYRFTDVSFLLIDYLRYGSLLDALNCYRPRRNDIPESVVLLLVMKLLKQIHLLHYTLSVTHNDLKLDNVMVTLVENELDIVLIDYGHAVDTRLVGGHRALCKANWPPACVESDLPILNKAYHPAHADYWQLATIAHLMLYGTPMRTRRDKQNRYHIQQAIRRYWCRHLWSNFFHFMLNPPLPNRDILIPILDQFQSVLDDLDTTDIKAFITMLHKK